MGTDKEITQAFKMPSGFTITGRSSSIRNVFVAAIVPVIQPTVQEIKTVLEMLGQDPNDLKCSYCGDPASEWDHLRPLVERGLPTGYPSSIRNLVPSCGKCNQSKGKSDWATWMMGTANLSPARRRPEGLEGRMQRLRACEAWANCKPMDIQKLVDVNLWGEYMEAQASILNLMKQSQQTAEKLKAQIKTNMLA